MHKQSFTIQPQGVPCYGRTLAGKPICANARREFAAAVRVGVVITGDTGKVHGPERPVILPFIATIEVRYNGTWMPEAKGSSVWWLQRELNSIVQCYRRVRVVSPWGEELDLNGEAS